MTMPLQTLPTKPSPAEREAYVDRILSVYSVATVGQVARGEVWYDEARSLARECGDVHTGAGVIAALSANKGWATNVALARRAFAGDVGGHTVDVLAKVNRILSGEDPADVLPMQLKTGNFYRCIADPSDPWAVVIDRHAHDVAAGMKYGNSDRGLSTPSRYTSIADAYREGARRVGMVPGKLQAIVWTVVVDVARNSRTLTGLAEWGGVIANA